MTKRCWGVVGLLALATGARAAELAFDSAADPVYVDTWVTLANGGHGWASSWINTQGGGYTFVRSSTTNGVGDLNGDGDIDTPRGAGGRAWGMLAQGNLLGLVRAYRKTNGTLSVGQTFEIDMDTPLTANTAAWSLLDAPLSTGTEERFAVKANSEFGPNYMVTNGSTLVDTGVPVTDQGMHFAFTLTGTETYSLVLTPIATGVPAATVTGSLEQDVLFPRGPIDFVQLDMHRSVTPIDANAVFFNNVAITPEPAATGVVAAGFAVLVIAGGRRGRRRRGR